MRGLLIFLAVVGLVVVALVVVGIVRFNASDEELNISVDRNKVERSIEGAADEAGRALEESGRALREGVGATRD